MAEFDFILKIGIFNRSIKEQRAVLDDFWLKGAEVLADSGVNIRPMPREWKSLKRNYFSLLFIAIFFTLDIPLPKLKLYARINHCLRSWVTACDNLLDNELKEMILTDLPGDARIFKSVHTLLVVDRIFFSFLTDALKEGIITMEEMEKLQNLSLAAITACGIEEAGEEGGVDFSISPDDVLNKVHLFKTGHLFTSPLVAPEALGDIEDRDKLERIRRGLSNFGVGCQILDDLTDLGMDISDRKHNYLASLILHGTDEDEKERMSELLESDPDRMTTDNISLYNEFPLASKIAREEALSRLDKGLELLAREGLPLGERSRQIFIKTLLSIFGHPKILAALRG